MADPVKLTAAQARALKDRSDDRFLFAIHPRLRLRLMSMGLLANERPTPAGLAALAAHKETTNDSA